MSKDQPNRKKSDRVEPELDFFSDDFNPLRALTTSQFVSVPERSAGYSQSVRKFESELKRERQRKKTGDLQTVRKFEEHQMPINVKRKELNNVLKRMEKIEGPLKLLQNLMMGRNRVKIVTRRAHEIRGELLGYITAFDKNWNITLENITENWKRSKKIKSLTTNFNCNEIEKSLVNFEMPKIDIISEDKKSITCQRFVNQLFIRGEHIVFITTAVNNQMQN